MKEIVNPGSFLEFSSRAEGSDGQRANPKEYTNRLDEFRRALAANRGLTPDELHSSLVATNGGLDAGSGTAGNHEDIQ